MIKSIIFEVQKFNPKEYLQSLDEEDPIEKTLVNTFFGVESVLDPYASVHQLQIISFHTNFNISERVRNLIRSAPGVEFCRILSRYRGIISIGKMFDTEDVKSEIENRLLGDSELQEIKKMLAQQYEESQIGYVLYERDGKITYGTSEDPDYKAKRELLEESREKYGGKLFKSPE